MVIWLVLFPSVLNRDHQEKRYGLLEKIVHAIRCSSVVLTTNAAHYNSDFGGVRYDRVAIPPALTFGTERQLCSSLSLEIHTEQRGPCHRQQYNGFQITTELRIRTDMKLIEPAHFDRCRLSL